MNVEDIEKLDQALGVVLTYDWLALKLLTLLFSVSEVTPDPLLRVFS